MRPAVVGPNEPDGVALGRLGRARRSRSMWSLKYCGRPSPRVDALLELGVRDVARDDIVPVSASRVLIG